MRGETREERSTVCISDTTSVSQKTIQMQQLTSKQKDTSQHGGYSSIEHAQRTSIPNQIQGTLKGSEQKGGGKV